MPSGAKRVADAEALGLDVTTSRWGRRAYLGTLVAHVARVLLGLVKGGRNRLGQPYPPPLPPPPRPKLHYFQIRGRGEPIRVSLSLVLTATAGWDDASCAEGGVDLSEYKRVAGDAACPFGQLPLLELHAAPCHGDAPDGGAGDGRSPVVIAQLVAILQYIARAYGLYGHLSAPSLRPSLAEDLGRGFLSTPCALDGVEARLAQQAQVDALLLGIEALHSRYERLVYADELAPDALARFVAECIEPAAMPTKAPRGAHFGFVNAALVRNASAHRAAPGADGGAAPHGARGFALPLVGKAPTVADAFLFTVVDNVMRDGLAPGAMRAHWPRLVAHWAAFAALPKVSAYLRSGRRHSRVNGNGRG